MADQQQAAGGLQISPEEIERAMTGYFGAGQIGLPCKAFSEKDVQHIGKLLEHLGKKEWSLRPRTYIVLRLINSTEIMSIFVSLGLFDIALPYNHRSLPEAITSPSIRTKFLEAQLVILTKATDLETFEGRHRHFAEDGDLHFKRIKSLGVGGFGEVDHVYSTLSCKEYARKRIFRGRGYKKTKEKMQSFENELSTLKRLSHHHLVEYIGSYTDRKFFGLIMSPIADMNLREFLNMSPFPDPHRSNLRIFFGCISSTVLYLHRNQIRHKDIKPENILVKGENVLITDFGTALDWTEQGHSTTDNTIKAWSVRYCAPEVANYQKRNSSADIWSLACVFFEMITVLRGHTIQSMKEYFDSHGTEEAFIRDNVEATKGWMQLLFQSPGPTYDSEPFKWISAMLKPAPRDRMGAAELVSRISEYREEYSFIGLCCVHDGDEDSDSSYQGSVDEQESSHVLTVPTSVQDGVSLEYSSHGFLDVPDQPLSQFQPPIESGSNIPNVARFPVRDIMHKGAKVDSNASKRQVQSQQQRKRMAERVASLSRHETNTPHHDIPTPMAKGTRQLARGHQDQEIHRKKPVSGSHQEPALSSSDFPPLATEGRKLPNQSSGQQTSWARLLASDDSSSRLGSTQQGQSERDHNLDTLLVSGTENSASPRNICDWVDCKNSLMTAAGNLYTASDIRKHYKECRKKGDLVFHHGLEDFLAHFELHSTKLTEIPESAVQAFPSPEEKFSQKHAISGPQTATPPPDQSPKLQRSETGSSSRGDSPVTSRLTRPIPLNFKAPKEVPKVRKRQISLKILSQSAKTVPSLNDSDTRYTQQNLSKAIERAQVSSPQEPAIDAALQPEPRYGKYHCAWPACLPDLTGKARVFATDLDLFEHYELCHVDYWLPDHPEGKGYQCPYYECDSRGRGALSVSNYPVLMKHLEQHAYEGNSLQCRILPCKRSGWRFQSDELLKHIVAVHKGRVQ